MNKSAKLNGNIKSIALIPLFTAFIAVCSFITVPFTIPFTMQTFGVCLAVGLLGGAKGTAAVLLYIAVGAAGVPVFAGFKSGIGALASPTGGYIVGFIFIALIVWASEKISEKFYVRIIAMCVGMIVCYFFGTAWFCKLYSEKSFAEALMICVVPFILPDAAKISLCALIMKRVTPFLKKYL